MKHWGFVLGAAVLLLIHAYLTLQWREGEVLLRVRDGQGFTLAEVVEDLARARLVFVGELHDQPSHHRAQLEVIRRLHEMDHPTAIGLEMFRADQQPVLDAWVAGELSPAQFLPLYYANWNFPWVYYRDIFLYAREHRIPMVGLNVPLDVIRQVARGGFESLSEEQAAELPPVQCVVDEEYEDFIRRALGMHGSGGRTFVNFCEAQLMWDSAMAVNLLEYLDRNPEETVVVIAGRGHAWKRGIPAQVERRADVPMRVIVPKMPEEYGSVEVRPEDADYFWLGLELR